MKPIAKQAIRDAHDALDSAINAVVGCAMFAPDSLRKQDLPRLIEALREVESDLLAALEAAGIFED